MGAEVNCPIEYFDLGEKNTKIFNPEIGEEYVDLLVSKADSFFEENKDLNLALIGGLAVQEFYSAKRKRVTSDIDISSLDDEIVKRFEEKGYEIYKNEILDKYSARDNENQIHIDIYTSRISYFEIDKLVFENRVEPEGYSLKLASPEDITTMKILSILTTEKGKSKHKIDIYSMILNPDIDFDLKYLAKRIKTKILPKIPANYSSIINEITKSSKGVMDQFSKKERRFLKSELNRLKNKLFKEY
ncbi:MAG: hypothetical protein DRP10_01910 [Candidatus Aenigmatarchaeota archaeon]|nr:MAG: hypothetical protein DRP10_01910 [Candidatus Aenigmarchaeota archaeon]